MKEIINSNILNIILVVLLCSNFIFSKEDIGNWRNYPSCKLGRLQSPIEINEYESTYANNFSFVYQDYKSSSLTKEANDDYAIVYKVNNGGYINFERGGVIKQYEMKKIEIYPGVHPIDGEFSDFEVHLIHEKNLDFMTNKNQYRSIQDANMKLVIVLRYKTNCQNKCFMDNGLLDNIYSQKDLDLNNYPIFQDKRAFFYEGSSLYIPCDENVNYYVIKDLFKSNSASDVMSQLGQLGYNRNSIPISNKYGRPVYKNFMNYREVLEGNYISFNKSFFVLLLLIFILF